MYIVTSTLAVNCQSFRVRFSCSENNPTFGFESSQLDLTLFSGIGLSQVVALIPSSITYCQIIAYSVYFLGASFSPQLPWNTCDAWWNTEGTLCCEEPKVITNYNKLKSRQLFTDIHNISDRTSVVVDMIEECELNKLNFLCLQKFNCPI